MSKVINTKLISGNKKLSGDNIKTGPCIFPFTYKKDKYNKCYPGKHGDWCATEINKKGKMTKYAFCDYGDNAKKTKKKKYEKNN